ncbi:MAG: hypothetical protein JXR20_03775 [Balneola sp.]
MKKYYSSTLFFLLLTTTLFAQRYDVKRYSVNEGLPSGQVYDIEFDNDGFAWFGTAYGVVRTDGINFTRIGSEKGLREEVINDLFIDSKDNFWVASVDAGVGLLQRDSVVYLPELSFLNDVDVNHITESISGDLWFSTNEEGIYLWTKEGVKNLTSANSGLPSNTIWDVYIDSEGSAWISTSLGLLVIDNAGKEKLLLDLENGLNGVAAYHTFEASDGRKWISSTRGVTIVDQNLSLQNISKIDGIDLEFVFNVNEDSDGTIWIATERDGLFWYSESLEKNITTKNGLSGNYIYRLVKDKTGNIWIATDGYGVSLFKDKRFSFYDRDTSFGSEKIYTVLKDRDGILWFTTENGLSKYDGDNFYSYPLPSDYKLAEIWDMEELPNGNLLLMPMEYPLLVFDGESISPYNLNGEIVPDFKTDILIDDQERIILAREGGVNIYDGKDTESIEIEDDYWASYVNVVYQDKKGALWMGTEKGIVRYQNGVQTRYSEEEGVSGKSVYEIREDEIGNLWFGTNKGVTVFKDNKDVEGSYSISTFKLDESYVSETIFLQLDGRGGLWQGTNAGLNYYNLHNWDVFDDLKSMHFALQEYGRGVEFNESATVMDDDGNLWFGTARNGVVKFQFDDSEQRITVSNPPSPFLQSVSINGEGLSEKEIDSNDLIVLDYDKNNVKFEFGALNYKDPLRTIFKHRLLGFEDELTLSEKERARVYTNLKPGEYKLELYAKSFDSDWNQEPAFIEFKIREPFWSQYWFLAFSFFVIAGLLLFSMRLRVAHLEKKKLNTLVAEQTKELRSALEEKEVLIQEIHHRVKNNLAVISGLLEMQSWNLKNEEASKALNDSKLRILAISKIHENLYQNENLGKIDFKEFLVELRDGIVSTMNGKDLDIKVEIEIECGLIRVDQAIPCGLIINELVTNSFKHAFTDQIEKNIIIRFIEDRNYLYLSVKDNGIGVEESILNAKNSSLGITLVKSLSQQLEAEIEIKNDKGALFELKIPNKKFITS